MIFIARSSLETIHHTVQYRYCIFSLFNRRLRIRLNRQNPLLSYLREREKVFNVGDVLLCVICQTVPYLCTLYEYHAIYIGFGIIRGFT